MSIGTLFSRAAISRSAVVFGCVLAFAVASFTPAFADYKKVGSDKRSKAQIAEDECEAQSNGSRQVIVGAVLGGLIGQAIGRNNYVKDCMKARGYEKVPTQKKKVNTVQKKKRVNNNFNASKD
jgi:hypothetical protein